MLHLCVYKTILSMVKAYLCTLCVYVPAGLQLQPRQVPSQPGHHTRGGKAGVQAQLHGVQWRGKGS